MTQRARHTALSGTSLLLAVALAACAAPTPTSPPGPAASDVLVVAHRGGAALAPENTMGAFSNALKLGVDMVECDVHLSQDGEVIVMHDPDLARTTDGTGSIRELTLAELKKLNAAARFSGTWPTVEPIPTLGEVLSAAKGRAGVQIEIKAPRFPGRYPGIEQKVIDAVNAHGMLDQVIVISFDFPTLVEVKRIEPGVQTGALTDARWMMERAAKTAEETVDEVIQATGADYYLPAAGGVSEALVKAAHARGLRMGTWTVDVPADMQRLAGLGIDAITTNKPDELLRLLGR